MATKGNNGNWEITSRGLHSVYTDSLGDTYEIYLTPAGCEVRKNSQGEWDTWEYLNWYEMAT